MEVWRTLLGVPLLEVHDTLGSTNDRGKLLLREGAPSWGLILAEAQSEGRGRGGKRWYSPPGAGLWFSLLVPARGNAWNSLLPIRVGMALARAGERTLQERGASGTEFLLKWPNDLLLGDRKVGGVLCEKGSEEKLVVGVGINVGSPPGGFQGPLESTAGSVEGLTAVCPARGGFLEAILKEIRDGLEEEGELLSEKELEEYGRRDALLGEKVESEVAGEGVARGLSKTGSLLMEGAEAGLTEVMAGSVFRR